MIGIWTWPGTVPLFLGVDASGVSFSDNPRERKWMAVAICMVDDQFLVAGFLLLKGLNLCDTKDKCS